jgi:hypothetical protein
MNFMTLGSLDADETLPACVCNCLIPMGLADRSSCNDVTCACLSASIEAVGFLTDCVAPLCKSSADAFASSATSLCDRYCFSVYGSASISAADKADPSSDSMPVASSEVSTLHSYLLTSILRRERERGKYSLISKLSRDTNLKNLQAQ